MIKVFIVEDDYSLQNVFRWLLERSGFEVIGIASDGIEAVEMFKNFSERPDIILMDHRMPNKNGLDAAKEIIELNNRPRIIFTSADNSVEDEVLSMGVADFLTKPFEHKVLIEAIHKVVNA